jgi:hypothetical protein
MAANARKCKKTVHITKNDNEKEETTYLFHSPSGNGICIRPDKCFRTGFIQRMPHDCLNFIVDNIPIIFIKFLFLNKRQGCRGRLKPRLRVGVESKKEW